MRIGRGLGQADGFLRRRGMVLAFVFGLLLCWPAVAGLNPPHVHLSAVPKVISQSVLILPSRQHPAYGQKSEWLDSDEVYIDEEHVSDGTGQVDGNGINT